MSPVDRTRRPPAAPPHPLVLPGFDRVGAVGGLEVHAASRHGVPEVSIRLVVEAGASEEPPAHAGLAELTARLLTEGTADRDAQSMARWLDRLGAGFDASVGYEAAILSLHTLSDVLEQALEFLSVVTRDPSFPEHEVERVRGERLDEIDRQKDEPALVADHALIAALYGDGLYGRPVAGTRETVAEITAPAVRSFHAVRYRPGGALLLACGDVDRDRLMEAVSRCFAGWDGVAEPPGTAGAPGALHPKVILIDRPGSPQAEVRVGTVGVPYGTPDHHAIILANAILGGLFNSRINMNLREDKGWTYGARSAFSFRRGPGPFIARTAVETPVTARAFEEILAEIDRMREELVGEEEATLARHALTLSLPLQFETASQITRRVATQRIYGLPGDYWETYRARIEAVTAEDVRDVCRRYLSRDRLVLLAVADAASVQSDLERLGEVEMRGTEPPASGP